MLTTRTIYLIAAGALVATGCSVDEKRRPPPLPPVQGDTATGGGGDFTGGDIAGGDINVAPADTNTSSGDTAGGDTNQPPGGDFDGAPIAAVDICQRIAEVMCAGEETCCTGGNKHASVAACEMSQQQDCDMDLGMALTDPRTGYDPQIAGERVRMLEQMAMACDPAALAWFGTVEGAFGILQGTVAGTGDCSPTTLTDAVAVFSCQRPNVCHLQFVLPNFVGTCGPVSADSGPCYTDNECMTGSFCDPPNNFFGGGGTCQPRVANTGMCTDDEGCLSFNCVGPVCTAPSVNDVYCLL